MNDKWDIILLVICMYGFDIFNISEYLLIIVGLMYFLLFECYLKFIFRILINMWV